MDFRTHPRYQQALQRIMALPPHYKAVLSRRALDEKFGDEYQRKVLSSALYDANKKLKQDALDLRRQEVEHKIDIANRTLDTGITQAKRSKVFDIANLGLSTYMGYGQLKRDRALTKKYDDLLEKVAEK